MSDRRWLRRLCLFYKIKEKQSPDYLLELITKVLTIRHSSRLTTVQRIHCRTNSFQDSFFPYCFNEWNKIDETIRKSTSLSFFKSSLLRFIRPSIRPIYNIHNPKGLKLLTRLRLGLSHLREHKFRHNFQDTINPLCFCDLEIEDTSHFLLHCHLFSIHITVFFDRLNTIYVGLTNLIPKELTRALLFGIDNLEPSINNLIIQETIAYILKTERFDDKLF